MPLLLSTEEVRCAASPGLKRTLPKEKKHNVRLRTALKQTNHVLKKQEIRRRLTATGEGTLIYKIENHFKSPYGCEVANITYSKYVLPMYLLCATPDQIHSSSFCSL